MKTYLYRLHFKGPVHFGSTGIGLENTQECLSSDSLTSALINAFSILGMADEVIRALKEERPAFVLSSLFPFGFPFAPSEDASETIYALPRPLVKPPVKDNKIFTLLGKDLKRQKYLDPNDFFAWIGDVPLDFEEVKGILDRSRRLARPWDREKGEGWWTTELRPRVALDRESQNSNIWFCGTLHFHMYAGLYGLIRIIDDKWKEDLAGAFKLLGELGLGGERTYGMGTFDFSGFEPLHGVLLRGLQKDSPRFVLLSNYYPTDDERSNLGEKFEAWDFIENRGYVVSGRMATTLKRKRIRMIVEGSVVKQPVKGTMADVTPDDADSLGLEHRVYRSGRAFLMPEGGAV